MATPFTVYKLIILYMLRNSSSPITNSEISEFILNREYTNYFHLQQALSELEETSDREAYHFQYFLLLSH